MKKYVSSLRVFSCVVLCVLSTQCSWYHQMTGQQRRPIQKPITQANVKQKLTPPAAKQQSRGKVQHAAQPFSSSGISYSGVNVNGPYVALTFDDGPSSANTPRLLSILRQRGVKATFFVVGKNAAAYPQILRAIAADGHEIGNHSYTHSVMSKMSLSAVYDEIRRTDDAIERATGSRPRTLRPPYGALTSSQRAAVYQDFGYPTIMWSVDPLDWKRPGSAAVAARIIKGTRAGSIILAHDIHAATVDAIPAVLDDLLARGYRFVTVSELIAMAPKRVAAPAAVSSDAGAVGVAP